MMILRTFILMITCFCIAIMVCCVFPALGNKVIDGFELIVNRRKMYREYLQRLNDYEEYSGFMENEEKKHQEQWLIDIQERAEQEKKEYIDSLSINYRRYVTNQTPKAPPIQQEPINADK